MTINQENINYYCTHEKFSEVEGKIKVFIERIGENMFSTNCSIDLFKALVMKAHLMSTNQISIKEFKPLVILLHPINRYCNINSCLLFKLYLSTDRDKRTIQFYKDNLKQEYISQEDEDQTGNFFTNLWDVKIGQYYMFCPLNMKISETINKYKTYLESKNMLVDKIKFAHLGRGVNEDDTIRKYSITSNYAVFVATIY